MTHCTHEVFDELPWVKPGSMSTKRFPCQQCGAQLSFEPGTANLKCSYCNFVNPIPQGVEDIEELDFHQYLELARQESVPDAEQTVKCSACAAEFTLGGHAVSDTCPFCGSNSIIPVPANVHIRPKSLLPFAIKAKECREIYQKWIGSRWLAPTALKNYARSEGRIDGMYIPYWTYDCATTSWYTGMRGDYYYVTETYTEDGETKTRQVRHTRWTPASGTVWRDFDDVLVNGSTRLPEKHARRLQNWDLPNLVAFQDDFLSGFRTERYHVGLEEGFGTAQGIMTDVIRGDVRSDIGGDEQQISSLDTQWDKITFKHILVPIWIGAYKFKDKSYGFMINGRTGEISGDAPISPWKVALIVLAVLAVIVVIVLVSGKK